jgi:outer membrane protein assembly factor BamB
MVVVLAAPAPAGSPAPPGWWVREQRVLKSATPGGGLVVVLGYRPDRISNLLSAFGEPHLIYVLDPDAGDVATARSFFERFTAVASGAASADRLAGGRIPCIDRLATVVVVEETGLVPDEELMRVLRPGGVLLVARGNHEWQKTVKPWPKNIDEWTHYLHSPTNNAVADDDVVGPPHHVQWVAGPRWSRTHDHLASVSAVVSAKGRLFYIVDEGLIASAASPSRWRLVARDAFNGIVLWRKSFPLWEGNLRPFRSGPADLPRRLVAVGDKVFVTLGYGEPVSCLDAATGKELRTYKDTAGAREIVVTDGRVYVVVGDAARQKAAAARIRPPSRILHGKKGLHVFDAETGAVVWTKSDADTEQIMPTTLAVAGDRVYFQNVEEVVAVEASNGKPVWRVKRPIRSLRMGWSTPTLVVHGDVVISADRADPPAKVLENGGRRQVKWLPTSKGGDSPIGRMIAYSAAEGKKLWEGPVREAYNAPPDVLVADGLVWSGILVRSREPGITKGLDPRTGKVKRKRPPDSRFFAVGMGHSRCHRSKATKNYLVLGRAGVEFVDVKTGKGSANHWIRGTCQYGVMPCNGLLYVPPHACACYIRSKLNSFNALAPKRKPRKADPDATPLPRLEKGPAYDAVAASAPALEPGVAAAPAIRNPQSQIRHRDWPTYRADASRSGFTKTAVPAKLSAEWSTEMKDKLSAVTVADGKVFVAKPDAFTVHALNVADGKEVWRFVAGSRVDSPPTIWRGRVLFGCNDGWVTCLRATDGLLAWRFRAAPEERRIVAYGRVESPWPVHGSVLVHNGVLYAAAGRSSFLDGGIRLVRLDAATGKLLDEKTIDTRDSKTGLEPQRGIRGTNDGIGGLTDVLSCDGASVFMRHRRFSLDGKRQKENVKHLFSSAGFLDGSWWHRTYWQYGTTMQGGYGGWPVIGNQVVSGRLLVCVGDRVLGYGRKQLATHGSHAGLKKTPYHYFSATREPVKVEPKNPAGKPGDKAKPKKPRGRRPRGPQFRIQYAWSKRDPVVARAMIVASDTLFIAGPVRGFESIAAFNGKHGVVLRAVSVTDGSTLSETKLDASPVFDGMAAAGGKLFVALTNGKLVCLAEPK